MWWDGQNLDKPHLDSTGKRWNFRVWHGFVGGSFRDSIFFWDDEEENTGVVHFDPGVHVAKIHRTIKKLVSDSAFREVNSKSIRFPLQRHYSETGVYSKDV